LLRATSGSASHPAGPGQDDPHRGDPLGSRSPSRSTGALHQTVPGARTDGQILLDGTDVLAPGTDRVELRRRVGMVFQRPNPFPTMSVYDNVAAGIRLGRHIRSRSTLDDVVERALTRAHLWHEVRVRLRETGLCLSGGQHQRLCIARALAVDPDVILLDEPCSALDPISTQAIEDLLTQLRDRYTLVIVTHNLPQAARISDVTAFLTVASPNEPGRLIEVAPTPVLFAQPTHPATDQFLSGRIG
jgi:phosphate transport system ATP-binding protein